MKWWHVLVVIIGIVIGSVLLKNRHVLNNTQKTTTSFTQATSLTADVHGQPIETKDILGLVEDWNFSQGILRIKEYDSSQLHSFTLDPTQSIIFIPSLAHTNRILRVSQKTGPRWERAFCPGDFVTIKAAGDKVVAIDNGGYRSCGFKGE